jgi:DGQHR domain-containing protein
MKTFEDIRIPVVLSMAQRAEIPLAIGVMPVKALVERAEIPRRQPVAEGASSREGYQRDPSSSRVKKLADALRENRVDLPTAVLLNLRDYKEANHIHRNNGSVAFTPLNAKLYVVDGQHRLEALKQLLEEDEDAWADYPLPFVCFLGASPDEELGQFVVVNSEAKSIQTNLALELLQERAKSDPKLRIYLFESGLDWKTHAKDIVDELAQTDIWAGLIRFPGDEKKGEIITSSGLAGSLEPAFRQSPFFKGLTHGDRIQVLTAFWEGIKQVIPAPFDAPKLYVLQKTTGVLIMHQVFVDAIERVRESGSPIEPKSYANVLRQPLQSLKGETPSGGVAVGPDFWLSGAEGAGGAFGNNAARRVLVNKIVGDMAPIKLS